MPSCATGVDNSVLSDIAQAVIACTGLTAIFLTQTPRLARWACWFGLAGEPAWFYSSVHAHQWGIFVLAFFYTFAWSKGIYVYWWPVYRQRREDRRLSELMRSRFKPLISPSDRAYMRDHNL